MAEREANDREPEAHRDEEAPPVLGPTEARQGQIILGSTGRRIWLGVFVLLIVAVLAYGVIVLV